LTQKPPSCKFKGQGPTNSNRYRSRFHGDRNKRRRLWSNSPELLISVEWCWRWLGGREANVHQDTKCHNASASMVRVMRGNRSATAKRGIGAADETDTPTTGQIACCQSKSRSTLLRREKASRRLDERSSAKATHDKFLSPNLWEEKATREMLGR